MTQAIERWHYPRSLDDFRDLPQAIERFVLPGFLPDAPLASRDDLIFTLGSCFAENLAIQLQAGGQRVGHVRMPEFINSPLLNKICLDYAATGKPYATDDHARNFGPKLLEPLRTLLPQARVLVFTVGLAYTMFRGDDAVISLGRRNLDDVGFRLTSVEENAKYLEDIVGLVRAMNPDMQIVFTLSPVPLNVSFVYESVIAADCLSKSTLRLALAKVMARNLPGIHYWPAFEIVRWLGGHMASVYGTDDDNPRHISTDLVRTIIDLFMKYYVR